MHPSPDEFLARGGLGLRDLVLVVREEVVDAARVQIERFAQILHGHGRAFNVPAGTPASPRRIPAHGAVGILPRLPEREVADVLLVIFVRRAPRAGLLVVEVDVRELAVAGELAHGEIHGSVLALVGHALFDQLRDKVDHFRDMIGRGGIDFGRLDVELLQVGEERVLVRFRVVGKRHAGGVGAADRLVVDVGEVHHLTNLHAVELHNATQHILEGVGAEIADMGEVIDRRSAGVQTDRVVGERRERFHPARERIEDLHFHGR